MQKMYEVKLNAINGPLNHYNWIAPSTAEDLIMDSTRETIVAPIRAGVMHATWSDTYDEV